jgi:hypothetical protein
VPIFSNQRNSKRLVRKAELIGWRAELDRAAEEAFELPQLRVVRQSEGHLRRSKVAAGHFPQSLNHSGDRKFGVLPSELPGKPGKLGLNDHSFRRSNELQTHDFVGDAAIGREERQRVADVFGSGSDIKEQSRFARP